MVTKQQFFQYEQALASALFRMESRGILVDAEKLRLLEESVNDKVNFMCHLISEEIGTNVYPSEKERTGDGIILSSQKQVLGMLKKLGFLKIPLKNGRETIDSAALNRLSSETADPFISFLIKIREISKLKSVYIEAKLHNNVLYSSFRTTGTATGRRASNEYFCGIGTNGQNLPKHSELAMQYRSCLIARPGKIFVQVDQKTAEDWIVNGIIADVSGDTTGIDELRSGRNRHKKLASQIFHKPESEISKDSIEYYLAKRGRYAGAYGVWADKMAESSAAEGQIILVQVWENLLRQFHELEPLIRKVFQRYVEDTLKKDRVLVTPLGRERMFFDLRPYSDNRETFRKGYAFIPQSTVGDNTGLSIVNLDKQIDTLVSESHDSEQHEVFLDKVHEVCQLIEESFDREIIFPNGFKLKIPIEFEIGYDLGHMTTCDPSNSAGLTSLLNTLERQ